MYSTQLNRIFFQLSIISVSIGRSRSLISPSPLKKTHSNLQSIDPSLLELGPILGNGAFGTVRWAELKNGSKANTNNLNPDDKKDGGGDPILVVTKIAKEEVINAATYLDTEAYLNRRLCGLKKDLNAEKYHDQYHPNIAPYLGECYKDSSRHLIWKASGNFTLEDVLPQKEQEQEYDHQSTINILAKALGMPTIQDEHQLHSLGRKILQQLLSALSYCHAKGIVHRDIKPANILIDESTHSLRLIDFGSAADMASYVDRRGYRGENKGVRNILYCAPEEFVEQDHPYAFDVYSVAVCWLRIMISGLRMSEDAFFQFRMDVRDHQHDVMTWLNHCLKSTLGGSPKRDNNNDPENDKEEENTIAMPEGWEDFFLTSLEGRDALQLLNSMMQYKPEKRPSASEALLQQPYLNPTCTEETRPIPPARPWSITSHFEKIRAEQSLSHNDDACEIPEWFLDNVFEEGHESLNVEDSTTLRP